MKLSKAKLKFLRSLKQKKFRQKYQNFIAEGHKLVMDTLAFSQFPIIEIIATEQWMSENENVIPDQLKDNAYTTSELALSQISNLKSSPPVILLLSQESSRSKEVSFKKGFHFYLDGLQDPGNIGTIIRTAEWFGFESVIRSTDSVDFFNPKVVQSSMGSLNRMKLSTLEIGSMNVDSVYGTDMQGSDISNVKLTGGIIVIGSEGKGMKSGTHEMCKGILSIPPSYSNKAESLNAATTAAIVAAILTINN